MVSAKCTLNIGSEQEIKKFKFGGAPEGTLEIERDRITFFKKSKAVGLMFGMIGSAIEGKGKEDTVLTRDMIVSWEKNGGVTRVSLADGRKAVITFTGLKTKDAQSALENFLR